MKFVLDENVPASVRECLEKNGYAVETIVDHVARGAEDPIVGVWVWYGKSKSLI